MGILQTNFNKFLWGMITIAAVGLFSFYIQAQTYQARADERITVIEKEIELIKIKQRQTEIDVANKVNRDVMDGCMKDINLKLDTQTQYLMDIYKHLPK